jgi:hypothetical protein
MGKHCMKNQKPTSMKMFLCLPDSPRFQPIQFNPVDLISFSHCADNPRRTSSVAGDLSKLRHRQYLNARGYILQMDIGHVKFFNIEFEKLKFRS